ncbi:hypothetical protein PRIC2_004864 [Phytophthora ramorum]
METEMPPDGNHFNQDNNQNSTQSTWGKRRANSDDRNTVSEMSAGTESISAVAATDAPRVAAMPRMNSQYRRDLEDLLWSHTQAVAAPDIDFDGLANLSLEQWDTRRRRSRSHEGFRTFTRRLLTPNIPVTAEVLVTGKLECSLAEAAALLRCPGEADFSAAMSNMHGRAFQRGSVVHNFISSRNEVVGPPSSGTDFLTPYGCVKTACFARPRLALFDSDERWCFLEKFTPLRRGLDASRNGFTISQRSLQPDVLPRAVRPPIELVRRSRGLGFKRSNKRTHQLAGLSLGYFVEVIPGSHPAAVRVICYGCLSEDDSEDFSVAQRRMKLLARGMLKLPGIVGRRRMSAQVPADAWLITNLASKQPTSPTASRCVSCSRALHRLLMVKKTRCYLCAHFVCSRCWIRQPLEAVNGRGISVLVCPHCLQSVQRCNYAHLAASSLSGRGSSSSASTSSRISMFVGGAGEEVSLHTAQVLPDADDATAPGDAVVSYLEDIFIDQEGGNSSFESGKTKAAISVLEELVAVLDEGVNRVLAHTNVGIAFDSRYPELDITITLQRLQAQFVREVLPLEACVLANAVTRAYPIDTSGGGSVAAIPVGPIPPNEAYRLEAIAQEQLLLARGCDGLKLICELATRELSCALSLVTIIGRTLQYVLATDFIPLQDAELPREHTLCQHLLMGDRPMLVQHPEADVRFCNLSLVVDYSVQFYAGFPIFSQDGLSVVGSLCCLDDRSREMTQSQYSTLLHLTRTASNIIATQCRQALSLQPLHKRG